MTARFAPARRLFSGSALVLALLACARDPAAAAAASLEADTLSVRIAAGAAVTVVRGRLMVPENRADPGAREIPVHFARLQGTGAEPRPPLFFLPGGPGNTSTGSAADPQALEAWAPLLEVCDVVLIDPRGTRDGDLVYRWDGPPPLDFFDDGAAARTHWQEMSRRALAAFRERGVDIAGYTTLESVADLDALRDALGLERIALMGFSYGTHLALAYLRAHEERVARAVLVGVEGPDHTLKRPLAMDAHLARIGRRVAADPAVGADVPDLVGLLERIDEKLAREPLRVTLRGPDGAPLEVPVGPFGLHLILRADIGDASDLPVFPRLLRSIDDGDPSLLAWFVQKRTGFAMGVPGMGIMTDAHAGASPGRLALIADEAERSRFADVVNFPFPGITPLWAPTTAAAPYHDPVVSDVPTLFLSGELDWNAPPWQAEEVRWGFARATHLIVADAGHEQTLWQNPGAGPVVRDFLAGHDVSGVRLAWRPLRFIPVEGPPGAISHPALGR